MDDSRCHTASTDPSCRPFLCILHERLMSPMWTRTRRCSKSSAITLTAQHGRTFDSFTNISLCHYSVVCGSQVREDNSCFVASPIAIFDITARTWSCVLLPGRHPACSMFSISSTARDNICRGEWSSPAVYNKFKLREGKLVDSGKSFSVIFQV